MRAVSFDAAGTLIHLVEPVGPTYAAVARRHGFRAEAANIEEAFGRLWRSTPPPFSTQSAGGESDAVEEPDERSWWRRFVLAVFRQCGTPGLESESGGGGGDEPPGVPEGFDAFFDALYRHYEAPGAWHADPEAEAVLARLSTRLPCVLLSNFDARLRRILSDLGLFDYFDRAYLSCELRLSKPDPRIFAHVADDLALSPAEILHVGDDPRCDWAGAESAGFRVYRAGRKGRPLSSLFDELSLA